MEEGLDVLVADLKLMSEEVFEHSSEQVSEATNNIKFLYEIEEFDQAPPNFDWENELAKNRLDEQPDEDFIPIFDYSGSRRTEVEAPTSPTREGAAQDIVQPVAGGRESLIPVPYARILPPRRQTTKQRRLSLNEADSYALAKSIAWLPGIKAGKYS